MTTSPSDIDAPPRQTSGCGEGWGTHSTFHIDAGYSGPILCCVAPCTICHPKGLSSLCDLDVDIWMICKIQMSLKAASAHDSHALDAAETAQGAVETTLLNI